MNVKKACGMLGLAMRAGKVASGEFAAEKAVKEYRAFLVIVACEASDNTQKKFRNMCQHYKVPYCVFGTKEELGHMIGKEYRAVLTVNDKNFAEMIREHLSQAIRTPDMP